MLVALVVVMFLPIRVLLCSGLCCWFMLICVCIFGDVGCVVLSRISLCCWLCCWSRCCLWCLVVASFGESRCRAVGCVVGFGGLNV